MGKKNKKNVKINQKIRKYFDDDPFDVGVERVSSETLSELFSTLGIYDVEHTKKSLLKTIRMLWSESDGGYREEILNFFIANDEQYESGKPKELNLDRDEKIRQIMEELDPSMDEEIRLYESFADVRSKKITIEKMETKLRHIRFEMKKSDRLWKS